jgi:hypothetical protein
MIADLRWFTLKLHSEGLEINILEREDVYKHTYFINAT